MSDYKDLDGLKVPYKLKVLHDGKTFLTAEIVEYKLESNLSDTLFAKP